MGDDVPYAIRDGNASLLEFLVDWTLDDFPHYAHNRDLGYRMPISSPQRAMEVFRSEFDAAWEYSALWISVWHPALSGRLARFKAVLEFLDYMRAKRRGLVRAARPGMQPCAEADGRGPLDAALRDLPALPEPAPGILQGPLRPPPAMSKCKGRLRVG
jgi:hypothetical protein